MVKDHTFTLFNFGTLTLVLVLVLVLVSVLVLLLMLLTTLFFSKGIAYFFQLSLTRLGCPISRSAIVKNQMFGHFLNICHEVCSQVKNIEKLIKT